MSIIDALERDVIVSLQERPEEDDSGAFMLPFVVAAPTLLRPVLAVEHATDELATTALEPTTAVDTQRPPETSREPVFSPLQAGMVVASHLRLGDASPNIGPTAAPNETPDVAPAADTARPRPIMGITVGDQSAGSIRLTVRHPTLGAIDIELVMSGRDVAATATVGDARGQAALRATESGLRTALAEGGMTLRAMNVEVRSEEKNGRKRRPPQRRNQED